MRSAVRSATVSSTLTRTCQDAALQSKPVRTLTYGESTVLRELLIGFLTAVVTAVLYLTGYGYIHGFYGFHGISVNELDFGIQEILVRSFFSLWRLIAGAEPTGIEVAEKVVMIALIGLFLFFLFYRIATALKANGCRVQDPKRAAAFALASLAILPIAISSNFVGGWVAEETLRSLPRAKVTTKDDTLGLSDVVDKEGWFLYHLETTPKTHYLVLRQVGEDFRWLVRVPNTSDTLVQHFH
jgi:hypothetical protein